MRSIRRARQYAVLLPGVLAATTFAGWALTTVHAEQRTNAQLAAEASRARRLQDAQGMFATEMPRLVALDAFTGPLPSPLDGQRGIASSLLGTFSRDEIVDQLATANTQAARALDDIEHAQLHPPPEVRRALGPLGHALEELRSGHSPHLDPQAYAAAWSWVLDQAQRAEAAGTGAARLLVARTADTTPVWADPRLLGGALGVIALSLLGAAAASHLGARDLGHVTEARDAMASRADRLASLFDAVRGFSTTLDVESLADAVVDEAIVATGAPTAALLEVVGPDLVPLAARGCSPDRVPSARGIAGRVVDSARTTTATVATEPALGNTGATRSSVTAAPFVLGGRVVAVLMIAGPADWPPDAERETVLSLLALCAAPALDSARQHDHTMELALLDELTGLNNKRRLSSDLVETLATAAREQRAVSMMMIDVDHFKAYNDTHGHPAGDVALRRVAAVVQASVRERDTVYRYGGEELAVLLPATPLTEALAVAERVRAAVALDAGPETGCPITVSIGVAHTTEAAHPATLLDDADQALYRAKHAGRNRVESVGSRSH